MRALWMALLSVAFVVAGCGGREEQQSRSLSSTTGALGLPGRAWDASRHEVLAAGGVHSLALDADGTVWAWGNNGAGQLGDGTVRNWSLPVKVQGLEEVESLAAGDAHSLALREDGTVWAWGTNVYGQLGRPANYSPNPAPQQVEGLSDVVAVTASSGFSLALREDGTVWAWGANWYGQLGQPANSSPNPSPRQVEGLSGVVAVTARGNHALALREDGTVWAWGNNSSGQLGRPANYTPNPTPRQVPGLSGVVSLSTGGGHVLALREDGTVWAWGNNSSGQLGRPASTTPMTTPQQVPGLTKVAELAAGGDFSLALREDGSVWAWGSNLNGTLGDGTRLGRSTPQPVDGLKHVIALEANYHALAMSRDGTIWGWGHNTAGQLGTGTELRATPVRVTGLTEAVAVSTGSCHSLALRGDGTVWAWGFGSLGNGLSVERRAAPVQVRGLSNAIAISAGRDHSLVLRGDGTVWAWGNNWYGQLGDGTMNLESTTPVQVTGLSGVVAIKAANGYSLALRADGTVWGWGANRYGQLGQPANDMPNPTPQQVPGLSGVVALSSSNVFGMYTLALREDGTVWAWGVNANGQFGEPANYMPDPTPRQVPGLSGVVEISAGPLHALAVREDGSVWFWGTLQLGDGTRQERYTPAPVPGLSNVTGISVAGIYSLVWLDDGTVWGFGSNGYHQLTRSEQDYYLAPVQRPELAGVVGLSASEGHAVAVLADGTLRAWGENAFDQIGDGMSSIHDTPARVLLPCRFTGMPSGEHRDAETKHCPAVP